MIKDLDTKYNGIWGYRRMTRFVNHHIGVNYNEKRIRRFLRILGSQCILRRSHGYYTKTSFVNVEENLLNRNGTAGAPEMVHRCHLYDLWIGGLKCH